MEATLKDIEMAIETKVRPYLNKHQGDITIVDYQNHCLTIGLTGACKGCPSAQSTMEDVVKTALEGLVEDVKVADTIDEELLDLARSILKKKKKL
ncbi:MAG: NifU family protein [Bacteroidales bacterium]|nr:NifU family protein [Bacteroidales bacterium]